MSVPDQRIIQGIAQGGYKRDRMCEALVLQTQRLLHAYLIKQFRITSEEQRSDIVMDSYWNVIKQLDNNKFRGEMTLSNYLHIVVRNKALSIIRQQKNQPTTTSDNDTYESDYEETDNDLQDDVIIEDCLQKALAEFKQKKPKQHQQLHHYINCDNHEDWVEKYGGTVASSKDRLYRVRKSFEIFYELFCGKRK